MCKCRWDTAAFSDISTNAVAPGPGWSVAQSYSYDKFNRVFRVQWDVWRLAATRERNRLLLPPVLAVRVL
jgi:hypothetical protein